MNEKVKKNIYHIHDKSYKDLYSKKEIAIDLLKNFVKKEFTKDLRAEDLTLVNKSFISSDYEETESDIVYKAKIGDTEAIFYILLEFQSRIDYRMPLRLLFYMVEILRVFSKNENHDKNDKNIKIPVVIPIVLYNGKQIWDVPNEFRKMFYNESKFHKGVLNFTYDVFDVNNGFTKEELIKSKNVTSAIFLLDQKITPKEFLDRVKAIALFFDELSNEELKAIKHWIKNTTEERLAIKANEVLDADKKEVLSMVANNAFILKEMEEEAKKRGENKAKLEVAKNLLDILDDETIALKTGLDIEVVKKLRKEESCR
ncbi:Rpn family recombination-promoting nuclease/putative transposase [Clostridium tarantellae]|uniref:Rpn family recombination-promoting nuclease/putative transposase n=1 Tax=Clostridium tarantellae TaxID=39493 RepID=A0A6I1MJ45_9CLOT|nr:Rpn family recombination-promoting nuclease/putative transposase [Clostridium tarantellae]MPQ42954.1 Rpn family recombination-promoting nuclease/putative transposase [Clostridium tarantellae]